MSSKRALLLCTQNIRDVLQRFSSDEKVMDELTAMQALALGKLEGNVDSLITHLAVDDPPSKT